MLPEYEQYLEYIEAPGAKRAFRRVVLATLHGGKFKLAKVKHGYMKNITFFEGDLKPYSIVPAKKWINFYVRMPATTHPKLTIESLQGERLETQVQGQAFKIKLYSETDSIKLLNFLGLSSSLSTTEFTLPDELPTDTGLVEGAVCNINVNAYERNPAARQKCIAEHGTICCICRFNFGEAYGPEAEGYIHVHHLKPLSEIGEEYVVDPIKDLRPVCPNCHAVLHLGGMCKSIEEVRQMLNKQCRISRAN